MDLAKKVKEVTADKLGIEEEKISEDSNFIEDLGADSLDTVELVMEMEEEFDIEIPDEDANELRTVKNVVEYLQDKV
ncbi:MAG: acyl carrier protein [Desulfatiglandaceae bacterium]